MKIAFLIFDKLTALDAIGPYEVLSRLPGAELRFVAKEAGPKRTDTGALGLSADLALAELADPDIVLVPGGEGNRPLMSDDEVLDWLRAAHERRSGRRRSAPARWCSAPPGSSRASARRATGPTATSSREFGAEPVAERVRRRRQGRHRGRRLGRDRHGAAPDRARVRRGRRAGDPARDRVRPRSRRSTPARPRRRTRELVELVRQVA